MVHTTRQNYKSKLQSKDAAVVERSLGGHKTIDELYEIIEQEKLAKLQLMNDIKVLGEIGIDVVRKMDEHRAKGGLTFEKCEEINDDMIGKKSSFDIIDRVVEILLACEERVDHYAEQLNELSGLEQSMTRKLNILDEKSIEAIRLQNELYNVGEGATNEEIQAFRAAEIAGEKYTRNLQPAVANIRQAPITPPTERDIEKVLKEERSPTLAAKPKTPATTANKTGERAKK